LYTIKMENDKSLTTTIFSKIYQGEKNADKIIFFLPQEINGVLISECTVSMEYILSSGIGSSTELTMCPELYRERYCQFELTLSEQFTEEAGEMELWLTMENNDTVLKSGKAFTTIAPYPDINHYLSSEILSQLDREAADP